MNKQWIQLLIKLNWICVVVSAQVGFFPPVCCSIHLRSWSAQVAMATACVQSALYERSSTAPPPPSLFLSGVFALPFTQRHILPWGLTGQKQEMQIMLTWMLINAKTLHAWLIIAIIGPWISLESETDVWYCEIIQFYLCPWSNCTSIPSAFI